MSALPAPRPARLRDIPRAAWILSRAFASTSRLGKQIHAPALARLHALAPLPVFAVLTLPHTLARQVYLDDARVGAVIMGPRHTAREALGWIFTSVTLIIVGATGLTAIVAIASAPVILLGYAAGLVWAVLAIEVLISLPLDREARRELHRHRRKAPKGPVDGRLPGQDPRCQRQRQSPSASPPLGPPARRCCRHGPSAHEEAAPPVRQVRVHTD